MSFVEDLTVFFAEDEFAESATYTAAVAGVPLIGSVIFDKNGVILGGDEDVQTSAPAALVPTAQWPTAADGDTLVIAFASGPVTYRIRSALPLADGKLTALALVAL